MIEPVELPQPTASYEARPEDVRRVCLLYSGGLDTSVMLKWIQDVYGAEVVALTVNLGQPGEDYEVVEGKARQLGAVEAHVDRRARGVRARLRAAGDQGQRALRRRLPAVHRARAAADREARRRAGPRQRLRHDRPRLHRQGQRPGAHRGDGRDARARAEGDRAGARRGRWAARRRSPTRASTASRSRAGPRSRPTRSTTTCGGARARAAGSRTSDQRARGRRLPARHAARGGAGRARDGRRSASSAACRSR